MQNWACLYLYECIFHAESKYENGNLNFDIFCSFESYKMLACRLHPKPAPGRVEKVKALPPLANSTKHLCQLALLQPVILLQ